MRKRLFEIIERSDDNDKASAIYDMFMLTVIIISLIPLAFKTETTLLRIMDKAAAVIFVCDYILRWATADFRNNRRFAFFYYPVTLPAIIDLVSLLPSFTVISRGFKVLRLFRMFRAMRVLRILKVLRYSRNFAIILEVIRNSKRSLYAVGVMALGYILIAALVVFNVEPDTFETFFDAMYWATISLTTVGYGDIYPTSTAGRIFTMLSSIVGIAIVALPSGIITAGFMDTLHKQEDEKQ